MSQVYLITGASTGFGALSARALAKEGHTVFAGMYSHDGNTSKYEEEAVAFARENNVDLYTVPLDLLSQESVDAAVKHILDTAGRVDVVVHNAGHMNYGPAESFTAAHVATHATRPVGGTSSGSEARRRPAAIVQLRGRIDRWGIETTIVSPGVFTKGTNHFADAAKPGRPDIAQEYEDGPTKGLAEQTLTGTAALVPPDADPRIVADTLVELSRFPRGKKPFRMIPDPTMGGGEAFAAVVDNNRVNMYRRMGLLEYLAVQL
ncbi:hypothetical protein O1611_g3429 [Lasiodiplodia mahajangana]|uniref:Uncharacterized protein n=1 Tax=Lasiodiplodia mahajangana TaxID=1108764 RepID=A0ACC2JS82_9PEZI|nr:hypothetical protein O1611_g3429 [Lasiodiplodia mahajangana]